MCHPRISYREGYFTSQCLFWLSNRSMMQICMGLTDGMKRDVFDDLSQLIGNAPR